MRTAALLASLLSKRNESNTEQSCVKAWLSYFIFSSCFPFSLFTTHHQRLTNAWKKKIGEREEGEAKKLTWLKSNIIKPYAHSSLNEPIHAALFRASL